MEEKITISEDGIIRKVPNLSPNLSINEVNEVNEVTNKPSQPQRDARGYFLPGNKIGSGNRGQAKRFALEKIFWECNTEDEMKEIWSVLKDMAKTGDIKAIKLYMEYIVGLPKRQQEEIEEQINFVIDAITRQAKIPSNVIPHI